jgi:hypothetical protein
MNSVTTIDRRAMEDLAAELTDATYHVVLRHAMGDKWLDLELDLWKTLSDTIQRLEREEHNAARACVPPKASDFFWLNQCA